MSEQEFKRNRQQRKRQRIRRDVFSLSKRSWFHLGHDGKIYVVNQKFGEKASGTVGLTRAEFEQFKRFYERGMRRRKEWTILK
jgi:hypothetical protein